MLDASNTPTACPPVIELDGRTRSARRIRQLMGQFAAAMGGNLTILQQDAVKRTAELQTFAETLRARALRGDNVDPAEVTKAENLADRARRALSVAVAPARVPRARRVSPMGSPGTEAAPNLKEFLARRAGSAA